MKLGTRVTVSDPDELMFGEPGDVTNDWIALSGRLMVEVTFDGGYTDVYVEGQLRTEGDDGDA